MHGRDQVPDGEVDLDDLWRATGPAPHREPAAAAPRGPDRPDPPDHRIAGPARTAVYPSASSPTPQPAARPASGPPPMGSHSPVDHRSVGHPGQGGHRRPTGSAGGALVGALVVPGVSTMRRSPLLGLLLLLAGVLAPLALLVWVALERNNLLGLAMRDAFLLAVMAVAVAAVVARAIAIAEVANTHQRYGRVGGQTFMAYLALAALVVPIGFGVIRTQQARTLLDEIFADRGTSEPIFVPAGGGVADVRTVLLLGSDGGPDRFGDRIDSMVLVSVHQGSGRTALVSVPRNLTRLQFPPGSPMAGRFPSGFSDLANAVYPYVVNNADMGAASVPPEFDATGLSPAAVVLAQGIGHSLGVRIDDYVFVDMYGFLELIDVLGGVTVELDATVPLPPNIEGARRDIPSQIGPGPVAMDGTLAIAYARTRYADSDYGRMERQRQLLSAVAAQTSPVDALLRLPSLGDALDDMMQTSLSRNGFADLMAALGSGTSVVESVGLAPPLVQPGNPDWPAIAGIVREVQTAIVSGQPSRFAVAPAA